MILIYLDKELDSSVEHNIEAPDDSFGFNVVLNVNARPEFEEPAQVHKKYNVTQVHSLYKSHYPRPQIAFESDIHAFGGTRYVDTLEKVTITLATKKHKSFN
jgi:hypothetical protein